MHRQAGSSHLGAPQQPQQQTPDHAQVFGLWRERSQDSLEMQRALRKQWAERCSCSTPPETHCS